MNITDYSREEINKLVSAGVAPVQALRDYDVIMGLKSGKTFIDVAVENRLSERQVFRIKNKYTPT